ncbi:MAG: helix-turn-helix domain-containing protein [Planctomycetota bacterium]|nr:helix-turn-helix domain-containing protein [Planctomycetota bacterium]
MRSLSNQPTLDNRLAYSMREVAALLGMSERSVYSMIKSGRLRALKVNRLVRIPREAIAELLEVNHGAG